LAYKLMKRGIISQVSMECDYENGECSICGKIVASKNDYCVHLRKYKGAEYQGKPVFEILHGVTFTGLGLLDRKGADENARITQVASQEARECNCRNTGGSSLEDNKNENDEQHEDAAKKKDAPAGGGAPAVDDKARIKELETENKDLKNQVIELQKQVEELQAESKAAANKSRAAKLIARLENSGMTFASDEEREKELGRLADLSDDAFAATEAAYDRAVQAKHALSKVEGPECPNAGKLDAGKQDSGKQNAEKDNSSNASDERRMRTRADVRPLDVDDEKTSLEDKLRKGFMLAYRERVGLAGEIGTD
nr:DNA methyltransferase [Chloroflexota bacterium]